MEWIEVTGRTVDEAKERALDELGVHESELEFELIDEGRSGFLGRIGRSEARIRARITPLSREKPADKRRRRRQEGRSERARIGREPRPAPAPRPVLREGRRRRPWPSSPGPSAKSGARGRLRRRSLRLPVPVPAPRARQQMRPDGGGTVGTETSIALAIPFSTPGFAAGAGIHQ